MILSILYFVLSLFVIFDLYRSYRKSGLSYFIILGAYFFVSFILQGLFLSIDINEFDNNVGVRFSESPDPVFNSYAVFIFITIFYFFFRVGYNFRKKVPKNKTDFNLEKHAWKVELFTASLFVASVVVYASVHNGFLGMLRDAAIYRSGYGEYAKYDFAKRFFYIGQISWVLFLNRFIRCKFSLPNFMYGVFIFVMNMLALLSLAGRGNIILFLIFSFLIVYDGIISKKFLIAGTAIFVFVVFLGDPIFIALKNMEEGFSLSGVRESSGFAAALSDNFKSILFEFQHPFKSTFVFLDNYGEIGFRWGVDFIYAILNLMPEQIWFIGRFETVAYINTEMLTGVYASTIPPGIVAFSLYCMGFGGILIFPLIFGRLVSLLENWFLRRKTNNFLIVTLYYLTGFKLGGFIMGGEPRVFMFSYFAVLVVLIFYCIIIKKDDRKNIPLV